MWCCCCLLEEWVGSDCVGGSQRGRDVSEQRVQRGGGLPEGVQTTRLCALVILLNCSALFGDELRSDATLTFAGAQDAARGRWTGEGAYREP